MLRSALRPNDLVPQNKTYWVHHYRHRLVHLAIVLFERFPECARCADRVRFEPAIVRKGEHVQMLREDRDFQHAANEIPFRSLGAAASRPARRKTG